MSGRLVVWRLAGLTGVLLAVPAFSQAGPTGGKDTIGVGPVKPTAALVADMRARGRDATFARVVEGMDAQITAALVQMRKFTVVARHELTGIFGVGAQGDTGAFDPSTVPEAARLKLPKYLVVTSVDSYLEENAEATFRDGKMTKRRFQVSAQATIYDTTTGEILDASSLQVEKVEVLDKAATEVTDAKRTDEMMPLLVRALAERVAGRTADVIFPAKVVDVDGTLVTINRGDSFGVAVGDVMDVYGATREVRDPDSGAVIKRKGRKVGSIRITEVEPTYAQGEVVEGQGIVAGSVVTQQAGGSTDKHE